MDNAPASDQRSRASLVVPRALVRELLKLYDVKDPRRPNRTIRGYDRLHALRTARMSTAVALRLGHSDERARNYQIACLLHDLGRAGLEQALFGRIWSWARKQGIPTRPREWRARYPRTPYNYETEAFMERFGGALVLQGIPLDDRTKEQVEMRLGYARRLARRLRIVKPQLHNLGIQWLPWMSRVMLYYYYPERLEKAPRWVRQLSEVLVACEQFEAYSNRQRGRDYYTRRKESCADAFIYLRKLQAEGILSRAVVEAIRELAASGAFDEILAEARGKPLPKRELSYLRALRPLRS